LSNVPVIHDGLAKPNTSCTGWKRGVDYVTKPIVIEERAGADQVSFAKARLTRAPARARVSGRVSVRGQPEGKIMWGHAAGAELLSDHLPPNRRRIELPPSMLQWLEQTQKSSTGAKAQRWRVSR